MSRSAFPAARRGAVSVPAAGLLALAVALVAAGVIAGAMISRRSAEAQRESAAAAAAREVVPAGAASTAAPTVVPADEPAIATTPPVQLEPSVVDLGMIKPGQSFGRDVQIRNLGVEPLKILYSRASCTCTSVDLANTVIPPGESVPLKIRYDGQMTLGPKSSVVRIGFEGYNEIVSLSIKAEVTLPIHAKPSWIQATNAIEGLVAIEALDGRPFRVLTVDGDVPELVGFDASTGELRTNYLVRWDFSKYDAATCMDAEGNPLPEWLPIETDHPECRIFDIYVRHDCTVPELPSGGRMWVPSERHALVGALAPGESFEYSIGLKWIRGAEPDDIIQSVTSESDLFAAELADVRRTADLIEVRVRITPAEGHRGLFRGTVWLHASRNSAPMTVIGTVVEPDADEVTGDADAG